jgi:transcriptional regulator with XRE-family HTH domain
MKSRTKLAQEIANLREMSALTPEKFCERADISLKKLEKLESGKCRVKKKDRKKIAKALQVPPEIVKLMGMKADGMPKSLKDLLVATQDAVKELIKYRETSNKKKKK